MQRFLKSTVGMLASSQAPAYPKGINGNSGGEAPASRIREAGASQTAFPSWSLGTSVKCERRLF
jgi:hypothetical protein